MKKNYFKKSLSLVLTALMLMSCWVFVAPIEADASATDATYRANTDKYGTPYWSPNSNNTRWMLWGNSRSANDAHFYMEVPKTIYLDVSETLQSAGYKISVEWSYGGNTDYRIAIGPAVWGYGAGSAVNNGSQMLTMTDLFSDYDSDVSLHAGAVNEYGVNGFNNANTADLRQDDSFDGNRGVITLKNTGSTSNKYNNIYLKGNPKSVGSGTYSTTEISPDFILTQKWGSSWGRNNDAINMEDNKPNQVSEQHTAANGGKWNEVWWDIVIYDKAPLKTATDNATLVYADNVNYETYVLNNGLSALKTLRDQGQAMLAVREQTNDTIQDKAEVINDAVTGLQFQAKNADLINKVYEAKAIQAKVGYNTLYTAESRQALQTAIDTATTNSLYSAAPVYGINVHSDAGAKAAADQTTIANLIANINTAINNLGRKYDIGYDNLFSFTDWALNPVKTNMSNGTIEIDADKGTIKITHDGSTAGTDNSTSQGTDASWYKAEVKGNTEYVLTWNTSGSGRAQIHVFYATENSWTRDVIAEYNGNDAYWFVQNGDLPYSEEMGKHEVTFTTLPATDGLVFRFGTCNSGDAITFSDIRLVKKTDYDAYANKYGTVREVFSVGDTKGLTFKPTRDGYKFDGWYTANGTKLESVAGLKDSDTVYAKWTQLYKVEFKNWNGNVIKTEYVAPGAAATAPTNPTKTADADWEYKFYGWDEDFSNVTEDMVVTATFTNVEHPEDKIQYSVGDAPDCETNGTITKYCSNCNYAWNDGEYFEDTTGEFAGKIGHNYTKVVTDSSTGIDGVHKIACSRDGCKYGENGGPATITEAHDFKLDASHPASTATCVNKGETYYKCACLQEKTVTGQTDPNNHVNTELRGVVAAECEKPGYTGDKWCKDCNTELEKGSTTTALEHKYTNYVYDEGTATCFADGTETATCDLCGKKTDTRASAGSKLTHLYENYVYNEGTAKCEVNGTETATCEHGCGTTYTREAANTALKHDYTGTVKDNGNGTHSFLCKNDCGTYGATVDCSSWTPDGANCKCEACGYTKAHAWGAWSQADTNNGNEAGKHTRTCEDCGAVDTPDCTYTSVKTDANCEEDAYTTYTCETCGHGYTVVDPNTATGHNFNGDYKYDADTDKHQQLCANDCGNYGVGKVRDVWADCSWSYENKEAGKHIATCVCGNSEEQSCSGGTATCTAPAECQFCKKAYGEKADHTFDGKEYFDGAVMAKGATCTTQAEYYVYCSVCKDEYTTTETFKYGELLPHTYTGETEYLYKATEAECEVNETYYKYCSACKASSEGTDDEATFEKPDTALVHKFNGTITCNKDGTHTILCSNTNAAGWVCDETVKADCIDSAISFGLEPATCTEQGYTNYQCGACNYAWKDNYTPALGHDYTKKIYTADYLKAVANCEHANIYWYACSRCERSAEEIEEGEVYTGQPTYLNGEVRKHNWVSVAADKYLADEATCLAAAKYYTSCSYEDCGKSSEEVNGEGNGVKFSSGSALGHDWVKPGNDVLEQYKATPADCVNDATYYYICSRADECKVASSKGEKKDGETWTLENSKSGHDFDHDNDDVIGNEGDTGYAAAKDATCDAAGNYEYWHCEICNKYFKDAEGNEAYLDQSKTVIKKREHDIENVAYKAATCEKDGHPAYKYCKYEDCDYTTLPEKLDEGYKATGHNFTGAYYCDTALNYHAQYCINANCDMITLADAEGNPYQVKTFGMVVDGVQVKYEVKYEGIDYVIVGGEPCSIDNYTAETVEGVHTHANVCVCGNGSTRTYSDEETFVETVAPTCTADGYDSYACPDENCGATWKKNIVTTEGHQYADTFTSNGDGTHSKICGVCGAKKETTKCSGGTATCKDKAICEICNAPYGTTGTHVLDDSAWSEPYGATCTEDGKKKQTCSACNTEVEVTAEGSALDHAMSAYGYDISGWANKPADFDATTIYEPTCKVEGVSISYCSRCDHYLTKNEKVDKTKHVWNTDANGEIIWELISGNCSNGYTYACKCSVCGAIQSKVVEGEHEWTVNSIVRDVCDQYDYIIFACSKCGKEILFDETYSEDGSFEGVTDEEGNLINFVEKYNLKMGEHSWSEFKITKEATCSATGRQEKTCGKCGEVIKEDIPVIANAHNRDYYKTEGNNLKKVAAIPATCHTAGQYEYYECTRCSYSENAGGKYTIPALGHADNDGDGICDNGCRDSMENIYAKKDGCICHKTNGFMKFIYSILRFFWKLFKINPVCECGAAHY